MLRITTYQNSGTTRLKLEGKLKGPWVLELESCWRSLPDNSRLIVDLADVEFVDNAGRYLLALMHDRGVGFITSTPMVEQLVADLDNALTGPANGPILFCLCILLAFWMVVAGTPAAAQDTPVRLNLARAVALASERNLEVKAGRQQAITAGFTFIQAKALRYGKIDLDASYMRLDDVVDIVSPPVHVPLFGGFTLPVPPTVVAPADLLHVRLEAGVPLYTGGKISNAIAAASEGRKAAEASSENTNEEVALQAGQLYLGAILAREVIQLNEQALESYRRHLEDARTAYRLGVVANYDVVRAEAALADQEKRLTEARNRGELVEAALRTTLSLAASTPLVLEGSLFETAEPQPLPDLMDAAMKNNPALEALARKINALKHLEKMEKGDYLPQIVAIAGKETVTTKLAQTDPNWFAGARATWTLFDGGARRARIAARVSEAAQARLERQHAVEQVELAVRSAWLEYRSQKAARAAAVKAAELSRESLTLAAKRFAAGAGTSLEVLDANVALTGAEVGARNSLCQMDAAYLRIHRYVGDLADIAKRIQP